MRTSVNWFSPQAEVAQLAEALDSKSKGCGFDSRLRYGQGVQPGKSVLLRFNSFPVKQPAERSRAEVRSTRVDVGGEGLADASITQRKSGSRRWGNSRRFDSFLMHCDRFGRAS